MKSANENIAGPIAPCAKLRLAVLHRYWNCRFSFPATRETESIRARISDS